MTVGIHPTCAEEFTTLKAIAGSDGEAKEGCWGWAEGHCWPSEGHAVRQSDATALNPYGMAEAERTMITVWEAM